MGPGALAWVIERINWLIGRFSAREDQRMAQCKVAVGALLKALGETRIHLANERQGKELDRAREEELCRLWIDAAKEVHPLDKDLADRCYSKGTYWADPNRWGWVDELPAMDISIAKVESELRKLL